MLPQVLTAAVLDVALNIARDLDDIRALSGALAGTSPPAPTPTDEPSTSCTRTLTPSS